MRPCTCWTRPTPSETAYAVEAAGDRLYGGALRALNDRRSRNEVVPVKKLAGILVVLSLAGNAGLGYMVWVLRQDLDTSKARLDAEVSAAEARLDTEISAAESRLTDITQEAMAQVPDVEAVRQDVQSVKGDVDDLENALFGPMGAGFQSDAIGSVQRDVRGLKGDAESLKFCVNNAFGRLQDYAARVAGYMGVIATGGIAARPTAITPRCY
jgi:hypothetical protein